MKQQHERVVIDYHRPRFRWPGASVGLAIVVPLADVVVRLAGVHPPVRRTAALGVAAGWLCGTVIRR